MSSSDYLSTRLTPSLQSRLKLAVNELRTVRVAAVVEPPGRFILLWQI